MTKSMAVSEGINAYGENDRPCGLNFWDFSKCDKDARASKTVKVWKPKGISFEPEEAGPYSKKDGPFKGLEGSEKRAKEAQVREAIADKVDWNKPDQVKEVKPKWAPDKQICKFSGK